MFQPYFDTVTLILYIAIGICAMIFIRLYNNSNKRKNSLTILFILLVVFSISRKVGINLGGMDAISYETIFFSRDYSRILENNEFLFVYFTDAIRCFTDNAVIYRLFCYSLIIISYIFFIKEFCPSKSSAIPYVLIMYPLLMSFNTMRNSMAMAMILIGLSLMKRKNDVLGALFVISSIYFHRMSIIHVPLILFYYFFKSRTLFNSKFLLAFLIITTTCVSMVLGTFFQGYVLSSDFIDGTDLYYLGMNTGSSFWHALASFIPLVLIFVFMLINTNKQMVDDNKFLYIIVLYDIIIYPCTFIFGMWRANEYFYIPRLTLWAILLYAFFQKVPIEVRSIMRTAVLAMFIVWFIDRMKGVYEDSAIMPYVFNWFETNVYIN